VAICSSTKATRQNKTSKQNKQQLKTTDITFFCIKPRHVSTILHVETHAQHARNRPCLLLALAFIGPMPLEQQIISPKIKPSTLDVTLRLWMLFQNFGIANSLNKMGCI